MFNLWRAAAALWRDAGKFRSDLASAALLSQVLTEERGRPIPLGDNRVLTYLDTGEPILVDSRSIDALNYILGWEIESHVMSVFLRTLKFDSVFIDVGANFGLFTIKAASHLRARGKIFAFEPNPLTNALLKQTVLANLIHNEPNVHISDHLVSHFDGDGTLHFSVSELGGASVHRTFEGGDSVKVKAVKLDSFMPRDLAVDVVKIDAEGHEPFVLEGMREIIARSPSIKIIMEFFDHFLEKSYGGVGEVQKLIAELGLRAWSIEAGGVLAPIDLALPLTGERYVLLAHSIDDLPPAGRGVVIEGGALLCSPGSGARIVGRSATFNASEAGPFTSSDATLFYGPYVGVPRGAYNLHFVGDIKGPFRVRLHDSYGQRAIASFDLESFAKHPAVNVPARARTLEVVVKRLPGSRRLNLREIELRPQTS